MEVSPTGFEPVGRAIANPKQDALLPAIALISLGFVIPPRPTRFQRVPAQTTLEGHTEGTCAPVFRYRPSPSVRRAADGFLRSGLARRLQRL